MQAQQNIHTKLYLPLIKSFHNAVFLTRFSPRPLLPCYYLHLLCSVFKVQLRVGCTLKIEQCKNFLKSRVTTFKGIRRRATRAAVIPRRSDLGMLHKACDLVRSP